MRFWLMESSVCLSNGGPSSLGCTVSYTFSRWLLATLIESRPLFKWRRFFLHLRFMTSCTFSWLVNPLHLAEPLPYAFSRRRLQYASSTAEPLHYDSFPTALLLELSVNSLLSSLHLVAPFLVHSVHDIFGLRSIFDISSLGGAASCAFG